MDILPLPVKIPPKRSSDAPPEYNPCDSWSPLDPATERPPKSESEELDPVDDSPVTMMTSRGSRRCSFLRLPDPPLRSPLDRSCMRVHPHATFLTPPGVNSLAAFFKFYSHFQRHNGKVTTTFEFLGASQLGYHFVVNCPWKSNNRAAPVPTTLFPLLVFCITSALWINTCIMKAPRYEKPKSIARKRDGGVKFAEKGCRRNQSSGRKGLAGHTITLVVQFPTNNGGSYGSNRSKMQSKHLHRNRTAKLSTSTAGD
jgi:hypothetical protein